MRFKVLVLKIAQTKLNCTVCVGVHCSHSHMTPHALTLNTCSCHANVHLIRNYVSSDSHMIHFSFSEELEQISTRHELQDDVDGVIVHTHTQHLQNVGVLKVPVDILIRMKKERGTRMRKRTYQLVPFCI